MIGPRLAGVLVPLFSIPSSASWGIGEFPDVAILARWLHEAGQGLVQLLPFNEVPPGEGSPYGALSGMALDPRHIALRDVPDWTACGGDAGLDAGQRAQLAAVRAAPRVEYEAVRALKSAALRRAFAWFHDHEWVSRTARAAEFQAFCAREAWWLDEYALFRALHAQHGEQPWTSWPAPLRDREPDALAEARARVGDEIRFRQYVQWVADLQWREARQAASPVRVFGDLPFMVSGNSADVWLRQDQFRFDASVGAPADAFTAEGQDWGLPVYRWDVHEASGFEWLRARARRQAALFDGYRVDHLVGFYRTYARPRDGGEPYYTPGDEAAQVALGEHVLGVFREPGTRILAEDLGVVPDVVRGSLLNLEVPGYKVLRWERHWHVDGQPFVDPAAYPAVAVATTGTHDTESLAVWWAALARSERELVLALPSVAERLAPGEGDPAGERLLPATRTAILEALFASPAELLILPLGDVFGWEGRINDPATPLGENWRWRLPCPVERLGEVAGREDLTARLAAWSAAYVRLDPMVRGALTPGD